MPIDPKIYDNLVKNIAPANSICDYVKNMKELAMFFNVHNV